MKIILLFVYLGSSSASNYQRCMNVLIDNARKEFQAQHPKDKIECECQNGPWPVCRIIEK